MVLLWIYYSAQIFLLGAEFTKVYASQYVSAEFSPQKADTQRARRQDQQEAARTAHLGMRSTGRAVLCKVLAPVLLLRAVLTQLRSRI